MKHPRLNSQETAEILIIYIFLIFIFGFTNLLDKNQFLILITLVTLFYFLIKKILNIINKQTIEKFNKIEVSKIVPDELLTYYTQSFVNDLGDMKDIKKVNFEEAREILNKFLETGSNNGENYLIGFSKGKNKFWEIVIDEDNKIEMMRINLDDNNIEESNPTNLNNIKKSLEIFFKLISK